MNQPQHEKNVFVEFFMEAVEFKEESKTQGRPVFREIPHVRIVIPGDRNNEYVGKATDFHKEKYPQAWQRFNSMQSAGAVVGTPLEQWPVMNRALVKEAQYYNIQTVEQLAEISDANAQKLGMGWIEYRRKARAYLDAANGEATRNAQDEENQRLKDQLAAMQAQIAELAEAKKPGRPKKETVEAD